MLLSGRTCKYKYESIKYESKILKVNPLMLMNSITGLLKDLLYLLVNLDTILK